MIHINKNVLQLKPSATLTINEQVKELRQNGETVFHFGFGQSPFKIHHSIVDELKKHANNNHYLPSTGLPALKKEISLFLAKHQALNFESDSIFIGPGSKELLYQIICLVEGIFFIPKGSWVSYLPQIKFSGAKHQVIETDFKDDYKVTAKALESVCKININTQKILILNSPNNPTGAVYTSSELKKLAIICKKYDVIVLSDEIYSQVNFKENFSPSIATYYPDKTIVFGGLSKVFSAGGYRLGFVAIPITIKELYRPLQSFFSETFSTVSSPIQYAAIKAYKMNTEMENYINNCSKILEGVSKYVYNTLTKVKIKCTKPQGAFYMVIDFEDYRYKLVKLEIKNAIDLSDYLLKNHKIALLPGQDFYFDSKSLALRLTFVDFNGEYVYNAYKLKNHVDIDFVKNHTPNIYNGIKALEKFLIKI